MSDRIQVPSEWWKLGRQEFGADVVFMRGNDRVDVGVGVHEYRLGDDAMFWCGGDCDGHAIGSCDRVARMVWP